VRVGLAFWSESYDEAEGTEEVTRQAREWAAAEPNVSDVGILSVTRPHPDRPRWYTVEIALTFRDEAAQMALELA